jgi:TPR repeat protein
MRNLCRGFLILLICTCATLVHGSNPALAGTRIALVLGNSRYQAVAPLDNPANDAEDFAKALRAIGFDVIEQRDAGRDAMAKAIHDFSERLKGAEVALLFYAGHGLQMNGENYLLPVDAKIENQADVRFNTINLTDIQQEMEGNGRANIIILDACRNNPFLEKLARGGRALPSRGLGRVEATGVGSLVVFSTQPNNIALDGSGRNSPFASALLKHVSTPGLEVRQMISKVRGDVLQATDQKQVPWDNSSLVGDVYLAGASVVAKPGETANAEQKPVPPIVTAQMPAARVPATQTPAPETVQPPRSATQEIAPPDECTRLAAPRVSSDPVKKMEFKKLHNQTDWNRAIVICEAAVKDHPGDATYQFYLGQSYQSAKNYIEAVRHYTIAADAGNANAQTSLGFLYVSGLGAIKNHQKAFDLFNKAAMSGDAVGIGNLGAMYASGFAVKQDYARALDLYEKSIEAGNEFALAQAGVLYFTGRGTPQDYNAAAQYFQQAADLGDGYSLKYLAIMYERGLLGPPDPSKASQLRLRAAEIDPESQDPVVAKTVAPQRANAHYVTHRRIVRFRYRFNGCNWLYC